jgi:hypothetical protein
MAGKNTGDCEYGFPVYGGLYLGDMEHGSVPVIGETGGGGAKVRNLSVKVGGVWTAVAKAFAKVAGTWQEIDVKAKVGGVWTTIHEK